MECFCCVCREDLWNGSDTPKASDFSAEFWNAIHRGFTGSNLHENLVVSQQNRCVYYPTSEFPRVPRSAYPKGCRCCECISSEFLRLLEINVLDLYGPALHVEALKYFMIARSMTSDRHLLAKLFQELPLYLVLYREFAILQERNSSSGQQSVSSDSPEEEDYDASCEETEQSSGKDDTDKDSVGCSEYSFPDFHFSSDDSEDELSW